MASNTQKEKHKGPRTFRPKLSNFETSCRYEGLALKTENIGMSISDLKLKYAR